MASTAAAGAFIVVRYHGEQTKPFPPLVLAWGDAERAPEVRDLLEREAANARLFVLDETLFSFIWRRTDDQLAGVEARTAVPAWDEAYEIMRSAPRRGRHFLRRDTMRSLLVSWAATVGGADAALSATLDTLIRRLSN